MRKFNASELRQLSRRLRSIAYSDFTSKEMKGDLAIQVSYLTELLCGEYESLAHEAIEFGMEFDKDEDGTKS